MSKIFFGIDLGTSNSSISYVSVNPRTIQSFYIEPATIKFNSHSGASIFQHWQRFPSVVYFEQKQGENKIITGFQAEEAALSRRAKPFENLFMSVKSDIGTSKIYEDSAHPDIFTPLEITAEIIKALIKSAEKDIGISPKSSNVIISIPASFSHSQREDTIK
ncbi:MAG: Hsp70 family protein, partial [Nitrospirota bacterium]